MRQCPTLPGADRPLIAHTIGCGLCMARQRDFYHKCHRCVYRAQPADFVFEPEHKNGTPQRKTPLDAEIAAAIAREQ